MALLGEELLRHRRHIRPQLVSKGEEPAGAKKSMELCQLHVRLMPEVEDVVRDNHIDRRDAGQSRAVPFDERQTI